MLENKEQNKLIFEQMIPAHCASTISLHKPPINKTLKESIKSKD